jgi:subtilase family serine protease
MKTSILFRSLLIAMSGTLTLYSQALGQSPAAVASLSSHQAVRNARVQHSKLMASAYQQLPSSAACLAAYGVPCYAPQDIQKAYGITPLLDAGYSGRGQTIVIIVSFGSPTIQQDLQTFDATFGLPDPPSLTVLSPLGTVPFDPTNADQVGWAAETSLDVEWSHAMAPNAKIIVLTSPVDETQGVQGLPEFLQLEQYALDHHLGQIISQSWGTAENTLFTPAGQKVLHDFEQLYERAAEEGVTVLAAGGDGGTENVDVNGNSYPFPTVDFPASSTYVTAVGGTSLYLDANGNYQSETVWNDSSSSSGASGGGVSQYFSEPLYQRFLRRTVRNELAGHRGIPDVAFNADPNTPDWVYFGFFPDSTDNGFYFAGGTSAAAPPWAGIVADANQLRGRPLGFLNPTLYGIGAADLQSEFFHDITVGNNAYNGLPGYQATPGWDLASGWGTPNLKNLLWELCR